MGGGSSKKPKTPKMPEPQVYTAPAAPPEPEETATAPVMGTEDRKDRSAKRRGTAALQIPLVMADSSGGSGLGIPR